jgi:hypothetical protein
MSASVHDGAWELTPADRLLVEAKRRGNRLRFAIMLLFFRARGRFPRTAAEVDGGAVAELARTLGVSEPGDGAPLLPDATGRTAERQRAEIRALLGFREATVADAEALGASWLRDDAAAESRDHGRLAARLEERCRALRIEPPTPTTASRASSAAPCVPTRTGSTPRSTPACRPECASASTPCCARFRRAPPRRGTTRTRPLPPAPGRR